MTSEGEILEVLNSRGEVTKKAKRSTIYKIGLLHKAVNILIFNSKYQLFLQQRNKNKSSFPLFWDISASEHLKPGETFKQAAERGLMEELSIKTKLKRIRSRHGQRSEFYKNGKTIIENEIVELFAGIYNGQIKIDRNEVKKGGFISLSKLKSLMLRGKIKLTPWALDEINYLNNLKLIKIL